MSLSTKDAKKLLIDYVDKNIIGYLNKNDRKGALFKAWGHVYSNHIAGDYVEFGVYRGRSLIESYKCYQVFDSWLKKQLTNNEAWRRKIAQEFAGHKPIFHGLDTFESMPKNEEENLIFSEGNFSTDYNKVKNYCLKHGLDEFQFHLYKGRFQETGKELRKNLKQTISIVNIDCDLYESACESLEIIAPFLKIGTVLMFDDYNTFSADENKGERRALREFCLKSDLKFEPWFSYQFSGQTFLCVGHKD